jgi:excisionase family DNA binding protein
LSSLFDYDKIAVNYSPPLGGKTMNETVGPGRQILQDGFATVAEAAKYLGLGRAKVYQLMEQENLAYAKFGKSRRIPWRGLIEYSARCMVVQ